MKKIVRVLVLLVVAVVLIGAIGFFGFVPGYVGADMNKVLYPPPYGASDEAEALHATLRVADLHTDSLLWSRDLLKRGSWGQVDIPRLLEGNVAVQAFTVVTKSPAGQNIESNSADAFDMITLQAFGNRWPPSTWTSLKARALHQAELLHRLEDRSEGKLVVVKTANELDAFLDARAENPEMVAGFLGIEGGHCLEGELSNLDAMFDAGYRMLGTAHFFDTELSGSLHGVEKGGLTEFGREVIARMEELNMIIDLAHASHQAVDDTLAMATRPLLVSHTGVRGTCDNQRNMSDEHLKGIAATGGVIGIGYWKTAVCGEDAPAIAAAMRYTADLVGVEHVALGSDYDGAITAPFDTSGLVLITEALMAEGFEEDEIALIMGENTIRVLGEALPPGE